MPRVQDQDVVGRIAKIKKLSSIKFSRDNFQKIISSKVGVKGCVCLRLIFLYISNGFNCLWFIVLRDRKTLNCHPSATSFYQISIKLWWNCDTVVNNKRFLAGFIFRFIWERVLITRLCVWCPTFDVKIVRSQTLHAKYILWPAGDWSV